MNLDVEGNKETLNAISNCRDKQIQISKEYIHVDVSLGSERCIWTVHKRSTIAPDGCHC